MFAYPVCLFLPLVCSSHVNMLLNYRTWLRGSLLILVFMTLSWTLRLLDLESDSTPLSYSASLALVFQGLAILVFHFLKAEDVSSILLSLIIIM